MQLGFLSCSKTRCHYHHWNELHFGHSCVKRQEGCAFVSANTGISHLSLPGMMNTKIPLTKAVDVPDSVAIDTKRTEYAFLLQYLTHNLLFPQHYTEAGLRDSS